MSRRTCSPLVWEAESGPTVMTTTTMMMTVTVVTTMTTMAEMVTIAATMSDGDVAIDAVGEVGEDDGPLAIACFIPAPSPV